MLGAREFGGMVFGIHIFGISRAPGKWDKPSGMHWAWPAQIPIYDGAHAFAITKKKIMVVAKVPPKPAAVEEAIPPKPVRPVPVHGGDGGEDNFPFYEDQKVAVEEAVPAIAAQEKKKKWCWNCC